MRSILALAGALLCVAPSIAKADEELCFINNSDAEVELGYTNYGGNSFSLFSLPANSGDQNTCHSVPVINGNSVEGDTQASYFNLGASTNGKTVDSLIYASPTEAFEMSTMPGVSQLEYLGMAFLNPVVGTGSFYFSNPEEGIAQDIPDSELEWATNTLVCNKVNKVCRYWTRGDDGVYRIYFENMSPTGYTPTEKPNPLLDPDYNG